MTLYKNKYRVETARLCGWDYSQNGFYFVTLCIINRENLLGHISNENMILNQYGRIVKECWYDLPNHYHNINLDAFVVMPNHLHGIVEIDNKMPNNAIIVETGFKPVSTQCTFEKPQLKSHGLFEFVRALKTFSARRINEIRNNPVETGLKPVSTLKSKPKYTTVWQSRFYDHIIRDDASLHRIRNYIVNNPKSWDGDHFNTTNSVFPSMPRP